VEIRTPKTDQEWEAYYNLRYSILREPLGQPKGSERNEGDLDGVHFALFENNKIQAIARLDQAEPNVSQVRFVAVASDQHGKGYGKAIMVETENYSKAHGNIKMVLQARKNAVDFYKKLGYQLIEKSHLLFGKIQHYKMQKKY
jgi:predicted GNAT family N-acyltransferase